MIYLLEYNVKFSEELNNIDYKAYKIGYAKNVNNRLQGYNSLPPLKQFMTETVTLEVY